MHSWRNTCYCIADKGVEISYSLTKNFTIGSKSWGFRSVWFNAEFRCYSFTYFQGTWTFLVLSLFLTFSTSQPECGCGVGTHGERSSPPHHLFLGYSTRGLYWSCSEQLNPGATWGSTCLLGFTKNSKLGKGSLKGLLRLGNPLREICPGFTRT